MMKSNDRPCPEGEQELWSDSQLFANTVRRAMHRAVDEAIAAHHRDGNPVAIWRDGRVVLWYPDGSYRPLEE